MIETLIAAKIKKTRRVILSEITLLAVI